MGLDTSDALEISAKTGVGIPALLQAIVERVPPPEKGRAKLRGLLFDSWFDPYHGAMIILRILDGRVRKGDRVRLMRQGGIHEITKVGVFAPQAIDVDSLGPGEVGFLAAGIKDIHEARVGDTITHRDNPCEQALEGFVAVKPMVFVGLYPVDSNQYEALRDAIDKLKLNDSSFSSEAETSAALGFGFRCGFLGLLHIEITQERLEREFGLELVTTAPTVAYLVTRKDCSTLTIDSPAQLPDPVDVESIAEPWIAATIHVPADHLGGVLGLCEDRRGVQSGMDIHGGNRAVVRYDLPMAEVVYDFYDRLKSVSRGYASLDYEPLDFRVSKLGRLDLLLNGERVDALSVICHSDRAYRLGKELALKLKKIIPRQMYEVVIQAATGSRVISRETVKALRKNVTAKCYGGDITRKRKLLEKQKEGKKRMKQVGKVEIPQEAFLAVLKIDG